MYFLADRLCIDELSQSTASEVLTIASELLSERLPGAGEIAACVLSRAHSSDYLREEVLKDIGRQGPYAARDKRLLSALKEYAPPVWRAQSSWAKTDRC
jgi:hypothetical protein